MFYLFLSFYARLSVSIVTLPSSFPLFTCASSIQMIMNHMPLCLVVLFFSHFIVLLLFFERNKWRWSGDDDDDDDDDDHELTQSQSLTAI